ncbi:MAG: polysaccharide deacetylase family protein [Ruminococcaceae bacterium]|nr:polysaccharide deacetylase family protein [Oscillospiraceae bacterium]
MTAPKRALCLLLTVSLLLSLSATGAAAKDDRLFFCGDTAAKKIALTFDDGPHPHQTDEILSILSEYGIRATFFVIGVNVERYPEQIGSILKAGCEIGSHTYWHKRLDNMSREEVLSELIRTEQAICEQYDYRIRLFRPPEGMCSEDMMWCAEQMSYRVVLWSLDTKDWAHTPSDSIARSVLNNVKGGDVILMHDYIGRRSPTAAALRTLIPQLLAQGYEFVTVSELIGADSLSIKSTNQF